MKKVLTTVFAVALMAFAMSASAQTPNIQVYFDENGSQTATDCPAGGGFDQLTVIANNWNMFMSAVEYRIDYGPSFVFFGDIVDSPLVIGNSPAGISISWPLPQNAFDPFVVQRASVQWNCSDCAATNVPVQVLPNPASGKVQATRWPDNVLFEGVGLTSLVCATVPVAETTWGKVKSLYQGN